MNDRIKQLLIQSEVFNKDGTVLKDVTGYELNKFAELIVRECLKELKDMIVDESELLYPNNKQTTEFVNDRLLDAYDNIKEHFGVEE